MTRSPHLYAEDILARIEKLRRFQDMDIRSLRVGSDERDLLERNLEIVPEASRHLPPAWKQAHPEVNWRGVADVGNALRHGYHALSPDALDDIIQLHIEPLAAAVAHMLNEFPNE